MELVTSRRIKGSKLIGLAGLKNSGKDTVANLITNVNPDRMRRYSFARPLKEGVKAMFGWSDEYIEDRQLKELVDPFWGFSPRVAMQKLGTEYGRQGLGDDVWLRAAHIYHQESLKQGIGTMITDVRFENEATWIRSLDNSIIIHVVDPERTEIDPNAHPSEKGVIIAESDLVIVNDKRKGFDDLVEAVGRLL